MLTKNHYRLIQSLNQKKYRQNQKLFIAEGVKVVQEFLNSKYELVHIFSISDSYENFDKKFVRVSYKELKKISLMISANEVLAIFKIPEPKKIDYSELILAVDSLNNPGNLGTIIRLCDWYGVKDLICSKSSVDCYNPKVIQASMGSICRVNISYMDFQKLLDGKNYNTVAADLEGQNLRDFNFSENQIIFFGSESNGFSKKLSSQIDHKITIQRYNDNVESLNLATSVGIILSQLKTQITGK